MNNAYTNRDEIAGLPALSVTEFFSNCETEIDAIQVGTWFHLGSSEASAAFQKLIDEGFLEQVGDASSADATKTSQARTVEESAPNPILSSEGRDSAVLTLLRAIGEVNSSPKTAHRVRATTLIGGALDGPVRATGVVEAVVEIGSLACVASVQGELEEFMVERASVRKEPDQPDADHHAASVQFIKDALLGAHESLSLRFVIK